MLNKEVVALVLQEGLLLTLGESRNILLALEASRFEGVYSHDYLRKLLNFFDLNGVGLRFSRRQLRDLGLDLVKFYLFLADFVLKLHDVGVHGTLVFAVFSLMVLQFFLHVLLRSFQSLLRALQDFITLKNFLDFRVLISVGLLHQLKEILVLLNSSFLLVNTLSFLLEDLKPELFLPNFLILLLDLFVELANLLVTLAHSF